MRGVGMGVACVRVGGGTATQHNARFGRLVFELSHAVLVQGLHELLQLLKVDIHRSFLVVSVRGGRWSRSRPAM